MKSVAALIVSYLETIGVEYVFGVPGGAVEPFYNALAQSARNGGPKPIVARHETGAAFMAEGYARETGKLGVCIATSGPGATNLLTGVANAFDNSIPMLVLTGQPSIALWGKGALQESSCTGVNIMQMFEPCTRMNTLISHQDQAEMKASAAILRAGSPTKGPVHISVPVDIQRIAIEGVVNHDVFKKMIDSPRAMYAANAYDVVETIDKARNAVFVIGKECSQDAVKNIIKIAEHFDVRFVASPDALMHIDHGHRLYRGAFGFAGHGSARKLVNEKPDLVIAFGVKFGEWTSCIWDKNLLHTKFIHIDSSPDNFLRTATATTQICTDIAAMTHQMIGLTDMFRRRRVPRDDAFTLSNHVQEPHKATSCEAPIKPQRLMRELTERFPDARFITDPGNSTAWAIHYLQGKLSTLMDFAPMGWSIGAAVGMAMANDDTPVVCITGDGSYLMSGQEITVAAEQKKTVIYVILNDSALGMVKHGQRLAGAEQTSFSLPEIQYARLAESMGIPGYVVRSPDDFNRLPIRDIMHRNGPTLIDVIIDGEEVPPMNLRI